jgi:hypothetical protein
MSSFEVVRGKITMQPNILDAFKKPVLQSPFCGFQNHAHSPRIPTSLPF